MERGALCGGARGSAFPRTGGWFRDGWVGALVALGKGAGVGGDDDRGTVVHGGRVGEVGLAEPRRRWEVHARTQDGRECKRKWAVCGRGWVNVGAVLETRAEDFARHGEDGWKVGGFERSVI